MPNWSRSWLSWLVDVGKVLRADPMLLAPTVIVILVALGIAYLAWRFV